MSKNDTDIRRFRRLLLETKRLAEQASMTGSLEKGGRFAVRQHRRDGLARSQDAPDHPRLPAELRHHPARFDRQKPAWRGERDRPEKWPVHGEIGPPQPKPAGP